MCTFTIGAGEPTAVVDDDDDPDADDECVASLPPAQPVTQIATISSVVARAFRMRIQYGQPSGRAGTAAFATMPPGCCSGLGGIVRVRECLAR